MNTANIRHIFIFFTIEVLLYFIANYYVENKMNLYLKTLRQNRVNEFNIVYNSFKNRSDIVYNELINTDEIKDIFKYATLNEKKDRSREALYNKLKESYKRLKNSNIRQLHFHLPSNESFIRFHRPKKYGDDLSSTRKTVAFVNKNRASIDGFEEGKIYNGFRFVYPLFDNNESYLGSVEISTPSFLMESFMHKNMLNVYVSVKKEVVDKKLFEDEKSNYVESFIPGYVSVKSKAHIENIDTYMMEIFKNGNKEFIDDKLRKNSVFSYYFIKDNSAYVLNSIPLQNPISKDYVGYISFLNKDSYIYDIRYDNVYLFLLLLFLNAIIFIAYYRHKLDLILLRKNVDELSLEKSKIINILDSVNNIIFSTNLKEIVSVNKAFLQFVGRNSLEDFLSKYNCICDFFVKREGFFSVDSGENEAHWVSEILKLDEKNRVVSMFGQDNSLEAFSVQINEYDGIYFVTFNKITELVFEKELFKHKAHHDSLTNIYNREMLNKLVKSEYASLRRDKHKCSLIMFDIDYFKAINDKHGHDVGDKVLIELTKIVSNNLRKSDIFARWGGEEFMILLPHANIELAKRKAEDLRKTVDELHVEELPHVSASFGVIEFDNTTTIDESYKKVDEALYEAKNSGRNIVVAK